MQAQYCSQIVQQAPIAKFAEPVEHKGHGVGRAPQQCRMDCLNMRFLQMQSQRTMPSQNMMMNHATKIAGRLQLKTTTRIASYTLQCTLKVCIRNFESNQAVLGFQTKAKSLVTLLVMREHLMISTTSQTSNRWRCLESCTQGQRGNIVCARATTTMWDLVVIVT